MHRRLWFCLLLLSPFFVLVACDQSAPTAPGGAEYSPSLASASGSWTAKAPMPTPRTHLAAGLVNKGPGHVLLYAIGGFDPSFGPVRAVEAYDIATNSWATRAPMPVALTHMNGVGNIGGKLFVSGGFLHEPEFQRQRSLYVYDPGSNSWSRRADMPKRTSQGVVGVIGGKLYVLVGMCDDCSVPSPRRLFRYDPVTNRWDGSLAQSPNAHVNGAGGVINGKFYVAGGMGQDQRDSDKLDVYDPATNRWTTLAPMPTARSGAAAAVLGGKLYVIGHGNVEPGEHQNQVEAYDPVTNTWSIRSPLPGIGRGDLAAGRVAVNGRGFIVAVGGTDVEGSGAGDANHAYTP